MNATPCDITYTGRRPLHGRTQEQLSRYQKAWLHMRLVVAGNGEKMTDGRLAMAPQRVLGPREGCGGHAWNALEMETAPGLSKSCEAVSASAAALLWLLLQDLETFLYRMLC